MRKILAIALAVICLAGCGVDDFRSYGFNGGATLGNDFYPLSASFIPTADGCDILSFVQEADGVREDAGGCIVKLDKKKKRIEVVHPELVEPEIRVKTKDGRTEVLRIDFISGYGDSFSPVSYPGSGPAMTVYFNKGAKKGLDLYRKKD